MWDLSLSGLGDKSGRSGCATGNCLWTVGFRPGMAGHLGGLSHGERFDADWHGLGISLHDCLVAGRRRLE
jgi:hypothetical protein